jgi:hypothetical protein
MMQEEGESTLPIPIKFTVPAAVKFPPVPGMNFTQKMLALWPVACVTTGLLLLRSHRQMRVSSEPLASKVPAESNNVDRQGCLQSHICHAFSSLPVVAAMHVGNFTKMQAEAYVQLQMKASLLQHNISEYRTHEFNLSAAQCISLGGQQLSRRWVEQQGTLQMAPPDSLNCT